MRNGPWWKEEADWDTAPIALRKLRFWQRLRRKHRRATRNAEKAYAGAWQVFCRGRRDSGVDYDRLRFELSRLQNRSAYSRGRVREAEQAWGLWKSQVMPDGRGHWSTIEAAE